MAHWSGAGGAREARAALEVTAVGSPKPEGASAGAGDAFQGLKGQDGSNHNAAHAATGNARGRHRARRGGKAAVRGNAAAKRQRKGASEKARLMMTIGSKMLISRVLALQGLTPSYELVDDVLALLHESGGAPTIEDARRFPHKFPLVRVVEYQEAGVVETDLAQLGCGAFPNLAVLKLADNSLRGLGGLHTLRNLRLLDLSRNALTTLPPGEALWVMLERLQVLLLHQNSIADSACLIGLNSCASLEHLTLRGNPIAAADGYRELVLQRIPRLLAIDDFLVSDGEQHECELCPEVGASHRASRYEVLPLAERLSLAPVRAIKGMPLNDMPVYSRCYAELTRAAAPPSAASDENKMISELRTHTRALVLGRRRTSPAITIQRFQRGRAKRAIVAREHARRIRLAIKMQAIIRGWHLRAVLKKQEIELLNEVAPALLADFDTEQARRGLLVKKSGDETAKAARTIQRVWIRKHEGFRRSMAIATLHKFARSVSEHVRSRTAQLAKSGFEGGAPVYLLANAALDRELVLNLLYFAVTRALRIEGLVPPGFSQDTFEGTVRVSDADTFVVMHGRGRTRHFHRPGGLSRARRLEDQRKGAFDRLRETSDLANAEKMRGPGRAVELNRRMQLAARQYYEASTARKGLESVLRHRHFLSRVQPPEAEARIRRRVSGLQLPSKYRGWLVDPAETAVGAARRESLLRADALKISDESTEEARPLSASATAPHHRVRLLRLELPTLRVAAWTAHLLKAMILRPEIAQRLGMSTQNMFHMDHSSPGSCVTIFPGATVHADAAAVSVQAVWRAHRCRQKGQIAQRLLFQRAAICVQRAWRSVAFGARMRFVSALAEYLRAIDRTTDHTFYISNGGSSIGSELNPSRSVLSIGASFVGSRASGKGSQSPPRSPNTSNASTAFGRRGGGGTNGSVTGGGESQNTSSCLYVEEAMLRMVRKLKGRKFVRNFGTLMGAQENPISSDCCFDFSNSLRMPNPMSFSTACFKTVAREGLERVESIDGDEACYWIMPPPSHYTSLQFEPVADGKGRRLRLTRVRRRPCFREALLRVGFPDWLNLTVPPSNDLRRKGARIVNSDLGRLLTRGAVLTSGELVVPKAGLSGNGKYFEKVSVAQRLAAGGPKASVVKHNSNEPTGIVLVRLKYRSRTEARMRAALLFARTWQARLRRCLPLVSQEMLLASYRDDDADSRPWGRIPSSFVTVIKATLAHHERLEADLARNKAILASAEVQQRATTQQQKRQRRLRAINGDAEDGADAEGGANEAGENGAHAADAEGAAIGHDGAVAGLGGGVEEGGVRSLSVSIVNQGAERERFAKSIEETLSKFNATKVPRLKTRTSILVGLSPDRGPGEDALFSMSKDSVTLFEEQIAKLPKAPVLVTSARTVHEALGVSNAKAAPSSGDAEEKLTVTGSEVTALGGDSLKMHDMVRTERVWLNAHRYYGIRDYEEATQDKMIRLRTEGSREPADLRRPRHPFGGVVEDESESRPPSPTDRGEWQDLLTMIADAQAFAAEHDLVQLSASPTPPPSHRPTAAPGGRHERVLEAAGEAAEEKEHQGESQQPEQQQMLEQGKREGSRPSAVPARVSGVRLQPRDKRELETWWRREADALQRQAEERAAARRGREEKRKFEHRFATCLNTLVKRDLQEKRDQVVAEENQAKHAKASEGREEERARNAHLRMQEEFRRRVQQENARSQRLHRAARRKRESELHAQALRKQKMRVEHEKGIRSIVNAIREMHNH